MRACERKKRYLWRKLKSFPNNTLTRRKYRQCTFEWRQFVRKRDRDKEEYIIASNDLGSFYKYINGRIGNRSSIGAIRNADQIIDSDNEKANLFNSYFSSVGIADNGKLPFIARNHSEKEMEDITITEMDTYMSIKRLKNKLTCGPDGLPPILFKKCLSILLSLLHCYLTNYCPFVLSLKRGKLQ
jgi:hypothetical protein